MGGGGSNAEEKFVTFSPSAGAKLAGLTDLRKSAISTLKRSSEDGGGGGYSPTISMSGESVIETGEYEGLKYPRCGISGLGGNAAGAGWLEWGYEVGVGN